MSRFHGSTLGLLDVEETVLRHDTAELTAWAREQGITLPGAFVEWAEFGGGKLLEKYSNDDRFYFDQPEVVVTPDGERGLKFHSENQDNFDCIALLDKGDDPPVLYSSLGELPWVTCTETFSDYVYAQIFDWQYMLEFDPDDPESKEIAHYGHILLRTGGCLDVLRERFEEVATTQWVAENQQVADYRFLKSPSARIKFSTDGDTHEIVVTGSSDQVPMLEIDLIQSFAQDIRPPAFSSIVGAMNFLATRIERQWITQLQYACLNRPETIAIDGLKQCQEAEPLGERVRRTQFPTDAASFSVGGRSWGVRVSFVKERPNWWNIDAIREAD